MSTDDDELERRGREHQAQAEVEAARLELTLWTLVRATERAVARTRRHPKGIELVVEVDGELRGTWAFSPQQVDQLDTLVASLRRTFEDDAWQAAGPQAERR